MNVRFLKTTNANTTLAENANAKARKCERVQSMVIDGKSIEFVETFIFFLGVAIDNQYFQKNCLIFNYMYTDLKIEILQIADRTKIVFSIPLNSRLRDCRSKEHTESVSFVLAERESLERPVLDGLKRHQDRNHYWQEQRNVDSVPNKNKGN